MRDLRFFGPAKEPPGMRASDHSGQVFESQNHIVAVFFKCSFNHGNPAKVVDMYRLEDGKLAEHWDVVQALPDDDAKVNGRGSF